MTWVLSRVPYDMFLSELCCYVFICLVTSLFTSSLGMCCSFHVDSASISSQRCSALTIQALSHFMLGRLASLSSLISRFHNLDIQNYRARRNKFWSDIAALEAVKMRNIRNFPQLNLFRTRWKIVSLSLTSQVNWLGINILRLVSLGWKQPGPRAFLVFSSPIPRRSTSTFRHAWASWMTSSSGNDGWWHPKHHLHPSQAHSKFDCCSENCLKPSVQNKPSSVWYFFNQNQEASSWSSSIFLCWAAAGWASDRRQKGTLYDSSFPVTRCPGPM